LYSATNELVADISTLSPKFEARVYPTGLQAVGANGDNPVSFKAILEDLLYQVPDTILQAACGTWIGLNGVIRGIG
jgi:hypothetical protein